MVARQRDTDDMPVLLGEFSNEWPGSIGRPVIDEHDLIVVSNGFSTGAG
jgi:hypothetical protein